MISLSPAEGPDEDEQCLYICLILGSIISNVCENEGAGPTPTCQLPQPLLECDKVHFFK